MRTANTDVTVRVNREARAWDVARKRKSHKHRVGIKMATNHSQSPAVVLRERRGKTAGMDDKATQE